MGRRPRAHPVRQAVASAGAVAVVLLVLAAPVRGHAELLSSTPAANSSVPEAPDELVLTFTEPIDPATAAVELTDAQGRQLEGLAAARVSPDGKELRAALAGLTPAVYTVRYAIVSAVDGHRTTGLFAFAVDPTGANPPPSLPSESSAPTADAAAVVARWVALAAGVTLLGIALFWLLSALPALSSRADAPTVPYNLLAVLAALALAGIAAYLALAARGLEPLGGAPGTAGWLPLDPAAPFGATIFANAMRVALLAAFTSLVLAAGVAIRTRLDGRPGMRSPSTSSLPLIGLAIAGLVLLAAFSVAGHASSLGGPRGAALDWLHLVGVAAWVGALPGLLALAMSRRRTGRESVMPALRRHGRVAMAAAPLVAITGIANTPAVIGPARDLVGTAYGNLVLAKALLFSVAVAIGAANWWLLRGRRVQGVVLLIGAEAVATAVAVLVAATMVTVPPAASRVPSAAPSGLGAAQLYGTAGATTVHLAVIRPLPGEQRYEAVTRDAVLGTARTDVEGVSLTFSPPPGTELAETRVALSATEQPWLWATRGSHTPVAGEWQVEVIVSRRGVADERVSFPLRVGDSPPPITVPPPDDGLRAPDWLAAAWRALPAGPPALAIPAAPLVAALGVLGFRKAGSRLRGRIAIAALLGAALLAGLVVLSRTVVEVANSAPPPAAAATNPVPANEESLERGSALYRANCASCHGPDGAGDGPASASRLSDLRAAVPRLSDGELSWVIERGLAGTRMPGFALTLSETDRWDVVNHLRARFDRGAR